MFPEFRHPPGQHQECSSASTSVCRHPNGHECGIAQYPTQFLNLVAKSEMDFEIYGGGS